MKGDDRRDGDGTRDGETPSREDSDQEKSIDTALRLLRRAEIPPAEAESQVIQTLKERGSLGRAAAPGRARLWAPLQSTRGAAAAFITIFAFGAFVGAWLSPAGPRPADAPVIQAAAEGPKFMLLVYENEGLPQPAPEEDAAVYREYSEWAGSLAQAGRLSGGEELSKEGIILASMNGRVEESPVVRQGTPGMPGASPAMGSPRSSGLVGGYFLLSVASMEEAIRIAKDCPHLRRGGIIEVRAVQRR